MLKKAMMRTALSRSDAPGRRQEQMTVAFATLRFLAVTVTGLALVAPGAHLFALANKIGMTAEDYFIVQRIYLGWWLVGLALPTALVINVAFAVAARHDPATFWPALIAAALVAANLAIYFTWTEPANSATQNWMVRPENWESLRRQWEYSHAVNFFVILAAFCAATLAAFRASPAGPSG